MHLKLIMEMRSGSERDNESGKDEEITHFVPSKNIGAAHRKNKQPR